MGGGGGVYIKWNGLIWIIECYVVFNKREVVFYQSTKGRGHSPRPFVL